MSAGGADVVVSDDEGYVVEVEKPHSKRRRRRDAQLLCRQIVVVLGSKPSVDDGYGLCRCVATLSWRVVRMGAVRSPVHLEAARRTTLAITHWVEYIVVAIFWLPKAFWWKKKGSIPSEVGWGNHLRMSLNQLGNIYLQKTITFNLYLIYKTIEE